MELTSLSHVYICAANLEKCEEDVHAREMKLEGDLTKLNNFKKDCLVSHFTMWYMETVFTWMNNSCHVIALKFR
jgi:hypothetical protein